MSSSFSGRHRGMTPEAVKYRKSPGRSLRSGSVMNEIRRSSRISRANITPDTELADKDFDCELTKNDEPKVFTLRDLRKRDLGRQNPGHDYPPLMNGNHDRKRLELSWSDKVSNFLPIFHAKEVTNGNLGYILGIVLVTLALSYIFYEAVNSETMIALPGELLNNLTTPLHYIHLRLSVVYNLPTNLVKICADAMSSVTNFVSESAVRLIELVQAGVLIPFKLFWALLDLLTCVGNYILWPFSYTYDLLLQASVSSGLENLLSAPQNALILVKNTTSCIVNALSVSINFLIWSPLSLFPTSSIISKSKEPHFNADIHKDDNLKSALKNDKDAFEALKAFMDQEVRNFEVQLNHRMNQVNEDIVRKMEEQRRELQQRLDFEGSEQNLMEKLETVSNSLLNKLKDELPKMPPEQIIQGATENDKDVKSAERMKDLIKRLGILNETLVDLDARWHQLSQKISKCCQKDLIVSNVKEFIYNSSEFKDLLGQHFVQHGDIDLRKLESDLRNQLFADISSHINAVIEKKVRLEKNYAQVTNTQSSEVTTALKEKIRRLVQEQLLIYDADKTGMFDYALESAGASVVSIRCTETYKSHSAAYYVFGIPIWFPSNNPRTAIQPGALPGECWAFNGTNGFLVIQLSQPVRPTQFSIEHIPREMSPNGKIDSAPRDFNVFGLMDKEDPEPVLLGSYTYEAELGEPIQYFPVTNNESAKKFSHVELTITSNHGNPNYTCLYRFRVHGVP